tara:strand:+ start:1105 stop:1518 length:414 start_codon:yes stop_codon:yes gene_type:complete
MKRILFILLLFIACQNTTSNATLDQRLSNVENDRNQRGEIIDGIISALKERYQLPMDLGQGISMINILNEQDRYFVYVYEVEPYSDAVNYITKTSLISDMRAANGFDFAKSNDIIMVWRYFTGLDEIKEIVIEPFEM